MAGGLLWHASAAGVDQPYSAWEKMSNNPVSSAPDCTVTTTTTGGYLHVVALSQTGTVLDVRGTTGAFTTTDLGAY